MSMSRQDKLNLPEIDDVPPDDLVDDDRLQIDLRLGLDNVTAVEAEKLRLRPRRRPNRLQLEKLARHLFEARLDRKQLFDGEIFGEPAWDMLLALYYMPRSGELLTVTNLSHTAGVPETTGLRWQQTLLDEGLIKRGPHILDRRLRLVGLTPQGRLLMEKYLTRLFHCQGGVPDTD